MSKEGFNFSVKEVMEARFRPSFRGYNQDEVDVFLDKVLQDYAAFEKEIDRLEEEVEYLKKGYGYK